MKLETRIGKLRLQRGDVLLAQTTRDNLSRVADRLAKLNEKRADARLPQIHFIVADHEHKFSVISRDAIKRGKR